MLWLYFALLVLEGVLRKWVLPGLSNPLLIVRDPLVIAIYGLALWRGVFPWRPATLVLLGLGLFSLIFGLTTETPTAVLLFGLRINYLHVPLIFVMALVLDRTDVRHFGRAMLWLTPVIAWMMLQQYQASRFSIWNVGAGGEIGAQLDGAMGKVRPSGPFTFVTGPVAWFSLVTAFLFYGWTHRGRFGRWALWLAAVATALAVAVSISRALLMSVGVVAAFGMVAVARDPSRAWRLFLPALALAVVVSLIEAEGLTDAMASRWESSTVRHGGMMESLVWRFLGDYQAAWDTVSHAPMLGAGVGLGSNAGARMATGSSVFLLAEAEWPKIVLELGPLLGLGFIAYRCWLAVHVMMSGWRSLRDEGDSLSWLLGCASFLALLSGQWGPPTILGFAVFGAGLALAAAKPAECEAIGEEAGEEAQADEMTGEDR